MKLWHFTCEHGYRAIGTRGVLVPPMTNPLTGLRIVWLTTLGQPDREKTGLGMHFTKCDRMAYRYLVTDTGLCVPWVDSVERDAVSVEMLNDLETYGDPEDWWITSGPTPVRLA